MHVDEVARRLAARGHQVVVFNRRWYAPGGQGTAGAVTVVDVPTIRSRSLDAISHSLLSTFSALQRNLDVFHYQCMGPSLPAPLPRLARKAVIATIHGFDYRAAKWGMCARAALRVGEFIALRVPQRTIVVAEHLRAHYAARGHDTLVVPNGVTPSASVEPDEIRRRWGLTRDSYILWIARLEPDKRAHTLIEAFSAWRNAHPDTEVRLVIAGPLVAGNRYISALRGSAGQGVVFVDEAAGSTKAELLANARGVVFPSRFEGLPISLLEAMSAGRAVLVSDIPAHREVVPLTAGLFCDASSVAGLTEGVERLLALSLEQRAVLGVAATRVAAGYSWDKAALALEGVYRDALRSVQSRARGQAASIDSVLP